VLDPYAKGIGRDVRGCDEMFGYKKRSRCFVAKSISKGARSVAMVRLSPLWLGSAQMAKMLTDDVWNAGFVKCLGCDWTEADWGEVDAHGEPIEGDNGVIILNAHHESVPFMLPTPVAEAYWEPLMDTAQFPGSPE